MEQQLISLTLDGFVLSLREGQDFSWLSELGTVFAVFDAQDSGNLCFGVQNGENRYFVKYAGAWTKQCPDSPAESIKRLRESEQVYRDLEGAPGLIHLVRSIETPQGYALLFQWVSGECMHAHWTFEKHDKYTDPQSPFYRFVHLPAEEKLAAMDTVVEFLAYVEGRGYTAVDLYDGSLMYDFDAKKMHLCDIDFYQKGPVCNRTGKFWGSPRFQSPEERTAGAWVDSVSNVYTLGALLFGLLGGGGHDRSRESWTMGDALYRVALHAVEEERGRRYSSVAAFAEAWKHARAL